MFAFASIGEAERIEQRSKAFTKAIQDSFPEKNLNLTFATIPAEQIKASGRNVKVTMINRPVGNQNMFLTNAFTTAAKTPDYAPLVLRIDTQYVASNFTSGFASVIEVAYQLGDENGNKELVNSSRQAGGKGETYMKFDSLLVAHKKAYEELKIELLSLVAGINTNMF